MAGGGFLDAAYAILKESGRPLHGMEIVRIGKERNMFTSNARDEYSLVRTLTSEVKRNSNRRGFTALGDAYFGLREWDESASQPVSDSPRRRGRTGRTVGSATPSPAGVTLEMLEQTRQAMPVEQFQQIWGAIYQALLAEERAKAITTLTDSSLKDRARKPVRRIHAYLQGRGNDAPKSEEICDWIHFCYTLDLYREAAALWQFVNQDDVHPWQYERTKKVAAVCRTRT